MRTLILGATGAIGSSVAKELAGHHHDVVALARSDEAERALAEQNFHVVRGDLRQPSHWVKTIHEVDAVIHVAATFTDDMGEVDRRLIDALIFEAEKRQHRLKLIYTGGCWLYGETGDHVATETDRLNPIPAFEWMVQNGNRVQDATNLDTIIIHPAMVYDRHGGVLSRFIETAKQHGRIEVWGSLDARWPVVHGNDLAEAYRLALENGQAGETYNVSTQDGVRVAHIVNALEKRFNVKYPPQIRSANDVMAEHGEWAIGPTLDQQMSGRNIRDALNWQPKVQSILSEIG
ncbi:MAG: NAD-dependent epimerase/dehydratase family protein [Rhodospirillaceae bacterium]|jgi:nucleoside-diphosphate-sugar epimerase|nr:NAD-dependent epimerase/dehydratase family protein [Rhodospirillaceae bacterium]